MEILVLITLVVAIGVLALLRIIIHLVGKVLAMLDLCLPFQMNASVMLSISVVEIVVLLVIRINKDRVLLELVV